MSGGDKSKSFLTHNETINSFSIVFWIKHISGSNNIRVGIESENGARTSVSIAKNSIIGFESEFSWRPDDGFSIESDKNVMDGKWHHIAFTSTYSDPDIYRIYVNGTVELEIREDHRNWTLLEDYNIVISNKSNSLSDKISIDDLGFFSKDLSPYDITGLYNISLEKFIDILPVNPQENKSTTWASLKAQR